MAHSLSAKKRVRQNLKHRARNRARKQAIRSVVKTFITTLGAGDMKKADAMFPSRKHLSEQVCDLCNLRQTRKSCK